MFSPNVTFRKIVHKETYYNGGNFTITQEDVRKAIKAFPEFSDLLQAEVVRQWTWNPRSHRYIYEGKALSPKELYEKAEFIQTKAAAKIQQLSFIEGWQEKARQEIKEEFIRQYLLGRGGTNQMTPADWGRIGAGLKAQYQYFRNMQEKEYSNATRSNILTLYTDSATAMFEKGRAASYAVALPAYPGDGSTECMARCACTWEYEERDGALLATWTLGPVKTEHCETCEERARTWAPFIARVYE